MNYVEMFLFDTDKKNVVLQRAPGGNWTGVFGLVKENELPEAAAQRIFAENARLIYNKWQHTATRIAGEDAIYMFEGKTDLLDFVCTSDKCVVNTFDIIIAQTFNATAKEPHPQLIDSEPKPDFSKGLKVGVFCNEYMEFNALVTRLRDMPENLNNRFFCVLSTTNMYGQIFDFIVRYQPNGALCTGAENAMYVAGIRGMKENTELFNALIKPAYEQQA